MNILILSGSGGYAGSTYSIAYLAKGLAACGHGVFACCPPETILLDELTKAGITVFPMALKGKTLHYATLRRIADIVREHDIGIINAQTSPDRYLSILADRLFRLNAAVIHTRRQMPLSSGFPLQNRFYTWGTRRIVAVSGGVLDALVRLGLPRDHITVIHNGTPPEKYHDIDPELTERLRERFGISLSDTIIGCVSRPKRQDQLLHALKYLDPGVRLMFVGPDRKELEARFGPIYQDGRVIFTGKLDNRTTLHCYPLFSVKALPSVTEGLSQSLLEAMAMGVPVVATRASGNDELIRDGENGFLFEDGDIETFAKKITIAVAPGSARDRIIGMGRKTALEEFSIERTIERYERLFEQSMAKDI